MKLNRALAGAGSAGLALAVVASLAPAAQAAPDGGRGVDPSVSATKLSAGERAMAAMDADVSDDLEMPTSYPYEPKLTVYPDNVPDASDGGDLLGHDDLAPMLMDWMETSNRVSAQVVGQSTQGRDLYLVTVTAPETEEQTAQQAAWKDEIKGDPVAAADDTALASGYKTPIWFSANIHGNEWEGTDGSMRYIEELVDAPWSEVSNLLRDHRLYFSLTLNPDGRTIGQRATALGFDENRDMITNTTPESTSFVKTAKAVQPLYAADLHGYTGVLQVEPCGPPHGENYEYDLFIPHAYAAALRVEQDVVEAEIPGNTYMNIETGAVVEENTGPETAHIRIPYRDVPDGWDDYPPIFTAQFAAYFGAVANTVELPRGRTAGVQTPTNGETNTAVARQTIASITEYVNENSDAMLANQIEFFRRGDVGAPKVQLTEENIAEVPGPDQWKEHWDVVDNQEPIELPRYYVIPVGDDQRSMSDAAKLVQQLLFDGIEVGTLDAATTIEGTTYPAGSFVVDMKQPFRGLANALLDLGVDISQKVPSMYDISAWSLSYLWGSTVDKVGELATDIEGVSTTPVTATPSFASVPEEAEYLTFEVAGVADYQALNALLEAEVPVSMLEDGSALVDAAPDDVSAIADEFGVMFEEASDEEVAAAEDEGTKGLKDLTIAYAGAGEDRESLLQLGFNAEDLRAVTTSTINSTPALLDGVDVIWVASTLNFSGGQATGRAAVQAFVDDGGSIVGRGANADTAANQFGFYTSTRGSSPNASNGIVAVDTPAGGVLAPYAQDTAFFYPAIWFNALSANAVVEQSYGADPMLAGHWRTTNVNATPEAAAGKPSAVSAERESGAKAFVFGTPVFFRTHPKGGMSMAARALFWAGPEGEGVDLPSTTSIDVTTNSPATYPEDLVFDIEVSAEEGVPTGTVEVVTDDVLGSAELEDGAASVVVSGLLPGAADVDVVYTPDSDQFEGATETVSVEVVKAASSTGLTVKQLGSKKKAAATVTVTANGFSPSGEVLIRDADSGKKVTKFVLSESDDGVKTVKFELARGTHLLQAFFRKSPTAFNSVSAIKGVTIN